ncbi:MAG: prepilin-type N-terminal cleavage/methylation domain-containing protein [Pirellulaceae bacterium]
MSDRIPNGFTMMELLLTLSILSAVGLMVAPMLTRRHHHSTMQSTMQSMGALRQAILLDYRNDMFESLPYPADPTRVQHPQLKYLYDHPLSYQAVDPTAIEATSQWTYDPVSGRGWSGPYIDHASGRRAAYKIDAARGFTDAYGMTGDAAPVDGWGNPIVLQQPVSSGAIHSSTSLNFARLVSAGRDGVLQTPLNVPQPTTTDVGDDIVVYLRSR